MEELIIKEREFKQKIVQVINESGLSAFIIKPVLKELLEQVMVLEQQQYQKAQNFMNEKEEKEKKHEKN